MPQILHSDPKIDAALKATGGVFTSAAPTNVPFTPEFIAQIARFWTLAVKNLPFIPAATRQSAVTILNAGLMPMMQGYSAQSVGTGAVPAWFDSKERAEAYMTVFKAWRDMLAPWRDNNLAAGQAQARAANDNAAFWEAIYQVATTVAAPVTAVTSAVDQATNWATRQPLIWVGAGLAALLLLLQFKKK